MSSLTDPQKTPPAGRTSRGAVATVVVTLALLAALAWLLAPPRVRFSPAPLEPPPADCPKLAREFVPSNVTAIADLPLTGLSAEQKNRALYRLNMEPCPCGCGLSVAACRVEHPACETSKGLAQKIVAEVQAEKPK
jgi:hypothetical protein